MPPQIADPTPLAGTTPPQSDPTFGTRFERTFNSLRRLKAEAGPKIQAGLERASQMPLGRYATLGTAGLAAATTAAGGDVLGGAGELAGGLAGGGLGSLAAGGILKAAGAAIPPAGPIGVGLKIGLPILGSVLGGGIGKSLAGSAGQTMEAGKTGAGGADVSIPGTPVTPEIPVSDAARERIQRERDLAFEAKSRTTLGQAQLGLDRQALIDQNNALVQLQKSLLPIQERTMRQQLVNQQALMNTQTSAYQQLGRQAGMFKLAGIGMGEAGATLRTAISQNPYAGSTIQAPSISFG
jgi:hypothetical protein